MFCRHPEGVEIDSVAPDMEWAGRELGRRALEAGYERIAVCAGSPGYPGDSAIRRTRAAFFAGYLAGIVGSVFPRGAISIRYEPPPEMSPAYKDDDAVFDWYGVPRAPGGARTLFVMTNDMTAIRLVCVLRQRGYRVPEDAGAIGMLDADCNRHGDMRVTTWRIDPLEMGGAAVEILLDRLEFPERPLTRRYLKPEFVDHGTL
mgnify:CR=1 FL=1